MSKRRLTFGVALSACSLLGAFCTQEKPGPLPPPRPRPSAFVLGTENKSGTHEAFEAATECKVNLGQFTTGWCGDWESWAQSGCGSLPQAEAFFAASPLHAVELSLAPWPHGLKQESYAACARGEYDRHYENFARSLLAAGLTHVAIRLGYEWDGTWFPWGTGLHETGDVHNEGPGGSALEYAECFKRFDHGLQRVAAGRRVFWRMVMNPIHDTFAKPEQLQQVLDRAGKRATGGSVDALGVDVYDYPERGTLDARMHAAINFARRNGMQLAVPEWGVGGESSEQPQVDDSGKLFVRSMHQYFADPNNNIPYASYFNCANGCNGAHSLVPPDNPRSRAAFVALFARGRLGCGADARRMIQNLSP